jgi:hypothetical protein
MTHDLDFLKVLAYLATIFANLVSIEIATLLAVAEGYEIGPVDQPASDGGCGELRPARG